MSGKNSFTDIAVNILLAAAAVSAAALLCIYFFRGRPPENTHGEQIVPIVINEEDTVTVTSAPETVTTISETASVTETTEETDVTHSPLPSGEYDPAFFEHAFFIGDSLSVGLLNYEFTKPENIFAQAGITPSSVTKTKIDDKTVYQKVTGFDPDYIVIMLGTNGLSYLKTDDMAEKLGAFVDELKLKCPDAKITVASIPPVTKKREDEKPEKLSAITEYNAKLKKLAEDKAVAFADVYVLLKDETGYMSADFAEHDGLHLKKRAYPVILSAVENAVNEFYGEQQIPEDTTAATDVSATNAANTIPTASSQSVQETAAAGTEPVPVSSVTESAPAVTAVQNDTEEMEETEILE